MSRPGYRLPYSRFALIVAVATLALIPLASNGSVRAAPLQQTPTPQPAVLVKLTDPVPDPKQEGVQWFAPTGHTLRGNFLEYWNKYGGLAQFGYPLTEEFVEQVVYRTERVEDYTIQYFERARFEHHPENAGTPYVVLLGALGLETRSPDPPVSHIPPGAQFFYKTGHNLSGTFEYYWETHGGLFVHGYPITEQIEEQNPIDGKTHLVQYFERSRFELHPENIGTDYEVLLGLLGRQLAQKKRYFDGAYPVHGYAADLSWVAGNTVPTRGACCFPESYCRFDSGKRIQPVGAEYTDARKTGVLGEYMYVILFGYLAAPDDPVQKLDYICPWPRYIVNRVQKNKVS
ncbi:MAG TPA: hypothetical protein VGE45_16415 [Chloroflexia bacterium]|jgi:hypothetical protein